MTYHPQLMPSPHRTETQIATASVWGAANQADIARVHVGIVGVGSVGSVVAESLARIGVAHLTLIDHDRIEARNLDRTLGALPADARESTLKVAVSERLVAATHTASPFAVDALAVDVREPDGLARALDCDVIFSCVDRPAPRHLLNAVAYGHLVPVVDGGILARVDSEGRLLHVDWRIHAVGPGRPCMLCLGALRSEDIQLDLAGKLDDPAYIAGLGPAFSPLLARQNVFAFSLSVAAHEVLQFSGLVTGDARIGGKGAQFYHAYPGEMAIVPVAECAEGCAYHALTATAADLRGNCIPPQAEAAEETRAAEEEPQKEERRGWRQAVRRLLRIEKWR